MKINVFLLNGSEVIAETDEKENIGKFKQRLIDECDLITIADQALKQQEITCGYQHKLICYGWQLDDHKCFSDYPNIKDGSRMDTVLRLNSDYKPKIKN